MKNKKVVKQKRENSKKENLFLDSYHFLLDSKKFILFTVFLFFLCFVLGLFISPSQSLLEAIKRMIETLLEQTAGMNFSELIWFIFLNNLKVSFFGMILGILFGFFPFILTIINGYFIGFVSLQSIHQNGLFSLWRLFPHGIFELPAIFISLGFGLRLGLFLFDKKEKNFWSLFLKSIKSFLVFVLPLLLVAAIIEASFIFFG
jgi:stage II sporulation protein M